MMSHTLRGCSFTLAGLVAIASTWSAQAQLTPDRLYAGVDRVIPMTASVPDGLDGEVAVSLLRAGSAEEIARAAAAEGQIDLAGLFPSLWSTDSAKVVVYAQLHVGEQKIGPAVVLQPLLSPSTAVQPNDDGPPRFIGMPSPVFSGYRMYVDKYVRWTTSEGEILFRLRPDQAPNTAFNFRGLVEGGFYTDIIFHRVVNGQPAGFVIQVGDPTGQGAGGPGYFIDLEQSNLPHDLGVLSMARTNDPNSNGSQVFVCLSRQQTQVLDGRYTAFGEAISGLETITAIANTPVRRQSPITPPVLIRADLIDADPYGEGAEPLAEQARNAGGGR